MSRLGNKANIIILTITTMLITSFTTIKASEAADSLHTQLENGNETAVVYLNSLEEAHEVIGELIQIDTDSPYDADMAVSMGTSLKIREYNTGKMELVQVNPINRAEAEKLLDTMEEEIRSNLKDNASDKETLSEIIRYIGRTYKYDTFARTDWGDNKNFVEAYNTDKKMICTQYSALTYLLCNRFGIDCKIVSGNDHRFNAIRLDGEDSYTAYDLTKTSYHLPAKVSFIDLVTTNYALNLESSPLSKAIGEALNERIDFHYSITIEEITILAVIVIIITAIKLNNKKHKKRLVKRH